MAEIIEIIQKLIDNGFAYEKDGDVYFEVKKYKDYGKLSNQKIEELELGARIDVSEIKKNPMDFALWKKKKKEAGAVLGIALGTGASWMAHRM